MLSTLYSRQLLADHISRKSVAWEPRCFMRKETDGQTDGQDEAKSRFSQICENA